MKAVRHTATLLYYDGPEIFEARDRSGGFYLAVRTDNGSAAPEYAVFGVSSHDLRQFKLGRIDLRTLMTDPANSNWYVTRQTNPFGGELVLERQVIPLFDSDHLPEPGLTLHSISSDDLE